MISIFSSSPLLTLFFIMLIASGLSGLLFLHPRVPLSYVRIHIGIVALPPLVSLVALAINSKYGDFGPWYIDTLAWLMAFFVLAKSSKVRPRKRGKTRSLGTNCQICSE